MREASRHGSPLLMAPWVPGVATALWIGLIFFLLGSADPAVPDLGQPGLVAALAHIFLYAVLACFLAWLGVTVHWLEQHPVVLIVLAVVLSTLYGGAMELYQATLPSREPSLVDAGMNGLGASLGSALFHTMRTLLRLGNSSRRSHLDL